ncbi:MAG: carbohydrate kinase family protein [Candidatus Caldarchaeum sp.]|nr:carbohydrate kinase family protein [Candidatus Caldarchaeum sp.]
MKIAVVGGLTIDLHEDIKLIGGPPWYAGIAVASTGNKVSAFSAVGEDYPQSFLDMMVEVGIDISSVVRMGGYRSFVLRHVYSEAGRRSVLVSEGPSIPTETLEGLDADIAVLSTNHREAGYVHLKMMRSNSDMVSLDVQGFLREVDEFGNIRLVGKDLSSMFKLADVIHCSDDEAVALADEKNLIDAVSKIGSKVPGILLVGSRSALFVVESRVLHCLQPLDVVRSVDTTGAGDMLMTFFTLLWNSGFSPVEAAASALNHVQEALKKPPPVRLVQFQPRHAAEARLVWSRRL